MSEMNACLKCSVFEGLFSCLVFKGSIHATVNVLYVSSFPVSTYQTFTLLLLLKSVFLIVVLMLVGAFVNPVRSSSFDVRLDIIIAGAMEFNRRTFFFFPKQ